MEKSVKKVFVCPANDGEAQTIVALLKRNGEVVLVTAQSWGASWDGLEAEIKSAVSSAIADGDTVYGIELQGAAPAGAVNLDHHCYENDDRSNPKSSIEQVASVIGVKLTAFEQAVAANDKGYIPLMREQGFDNDTIQKVRLLDRSAQGITPEQEAAAEVAITKAEATGKLTVVRLAHSKCATVTDRMYGQYTNLLVLCEDGESDFYGDGGIIAELQSRFGGWSGGQLPKSGFWGGYADQEKVEKAVRELAV